MMTDKPEFTEMEQRILFQIYSDLHRGLAHWMSNIRKAQEYATWGLANESNLPNFEYSKMNFWSARELRKLLGWGSNRDYPKVEWLEQEFPLLFEDGVGFFTLGEWDEETKTRGEFSRKRVDAYFAELQKLFNILDRAAIDDLIS